MDNIEKFKKISQSITDLSSRKIRLEERFKSEKAALEKVLKEVTDKGYDPKKLTEIRAEKEEQLKTLIQEIEDGLKTAEQKIVAMERV